MLACDQAVKVFVGPVVGLVTGDTARILLEVDHVAEVDTSLFFFLQYKNNPGIFSMNLLRRTYRPRNLEHNSSHSLLLITTDHRPRMRCRRVMPWRTPSSYGAVIVPSPAAPVLSAHEALAGRALHRLLQWTVPQRCAEQIGRAHV